MSLTPDQLVLIIRGKATAELRQQFLDESANADSETSQALHAAEAWARGKLNQRCPSPDITQKQPDRPAASAYKILKKAAFSQTAGSTPRQPVLGDLIAYLRGTASPEMETMVRNALNDPDSPLSLMLRDLENRQGRG
jgi:hypothetical protein